MPTIVTRGAVSAQAFGFAAQSTANINYTWIFSCVSASPTSFTVPSCVTSLTVEGIGGGGGATTTAAGGGGAYAKSVISVTPGQTVYYSAAGGSSNIWLNKSSNAITSLVDCGVLAKPGSTASGCTGGAGGSACSSVGQTKYSGGNGGNGFGTSGGGGGGGSASPSANGKNGAAGTTYGGGGGGGAGGALSTAGTSAVSGTGGQGGNGPLGSGGGVSGTSTICAGVGANGGGGGGSGSSIRGKGGAGSTYDYWGAGIGPSGGGGGSYGTSYISGATGYFGAGRTATNNVQGNGLITVTMQKANVSEISIGVGKSFSTVNQYGLFNNIITVDSSGNMYVVSMGSDYPNDNCTLSKIDSTGKIVWSKSLTGFFYDPIACVDSSYNLYLTSMAYKGSTFYTTIIKYNSSGVQQWQRYYIISGISYGNIKSSCVDSSNNIWILRFDGSTQYLIKYNSSGTYLNAYYFNYSGTTYFQDGYITADTSGYVYLSITGYNADCCYGYYYQYMSKISTSGVVQWTKGDSGNGSTNGFGFTFGITIDSSSNVYWAMTDVAGGRMNISKFNSSGTLQWTFRDVTYQNASPNQYMIRNSAMSIDSSNNNYVVAPSNYYIGDIYKVNSSGSLVYAKSITDKGSVNGTIGNLSSVAVQGTSYFYVSQTARPSSPQPFMRFNQSGPTNGTYGTTSITTYSPTTTSASVTVSATDPTLYSQTVTSTSTSIFSDADSGCTTIVGIM